TNHLDLPARQVLEEILGDYDGTMIFVSHDRYFLDSLATKLWVLEDGAVTVHAGNYSTYRRRRAQVEAATAVQAATQVPAPRPGTTAKSTGLASRSVEGVEAEIAALEARIAEIERALTEASAASDVASIAELGDEYEREHARLGALYDEWQALAS